MKNIHVLPTDKPSRLWVNNLKRRLEFEKDDLIGSNTAKHIYITSDEEIREGNWVFGGLDGIDIKKYGKYFAQDWKKIILTTDGDLIKDGVQAIDDEFLEWFVKNPSCEEVEVIIEYKDGYGNWFKYDKEFWDQRDNKPKFGTRYKIIIPKEEPKALTKLEIAKNIASIGIGKKEEPKQFSMDANLYENHSIVLPELSKQETLEEIKPKDIQRIISSTDAQTASIEIVKLFNKQQQERSYSDIENFINWIDEEEISRIFGLWIQYFNDKDNYLTTKELFEQFKKK